VSSRDRTKPVAMSLFSGKCGGCGAEVEALTRGDLPSCPKGTVESGRKPEGAAEVSRGRRRTGDPSKGPNVPTEGRPSGFVVVGTQQLQFDWDRLPGSESGGLRCGKRRRQRKDPHPPRPS
jgi:hypothetical protein